MSKKFRKICPKIWNDAQFRLLSDMGKLAFFFLLTHPHLTAAGAMRATAAGLAAELQWSEEAFRKVLEKAFENGMVKMDEEACFWVLPNFLKYNPPESPNVVIAWAKSLESLPECPLRDELIQLINNILKGYSQGYQKAFQKGLAESFPKASTNQEQEQEQEQETTFTQDHYLEQFDQARRLYPHTKRGLKTEFDNFKKKHKDWKSVLTLLGPAIQHQIEYRQHLKATGQFCPEWKHFRTWINNRCWEDEIPESDPLTRAATDNDLQQLEGLL